MVEASVSIRAIFPDAWFVFAYQAHYWITLLPHLAALCGYSKREMHETLLRHFYGRTDIDFPDSEAWRAHVEDTAALARWLEDEGNNTNAKGANDGSEHD